LHLVSCGSHDPDSTGGTGDIAFKIDWQNAPTSSKSKISNPTSHIPSYAPIDCTASNVSTVNATVYSSSGSSLATGGPWNCSAHSGSITSVPAGSNRKLTVLGKDSSGNVKYMGEQTGITVEDGKTSPTVTVTATSFVPTGISASAGNGQVSISWSSVSGATSGVITSTGQRHRE